MTEQAEPPAPARGTWSLTRMIDAFALADAWAASGEVPALSLCVTQAGATLGKQAGPVGPASLFLAASLTKPVVATAVLRLVERGWLTLDEPVAAIVPAFQGEGKAEVRVRHLLAHTSGLPDMLPDNNDLRANRAPVEAFVAGTCAAPLLFPPGTGSAYSSMGYALLGQIIAELAGEPLAAHLAREVLAPLGMKDTSLGLPPDRAGPVVPIALGPDAGPSEQTWNTDYWLRLGAAWGGLITTAEDYSRFLTTILAGGTTAEGVHLLGPAAARLAVANQTATFRGIDSDAAHFRPWGFGWRLMWPGTSGYFGDLIGPRGYGHWGATGSLAWADPDRDASLVILTNRPQGAEGAYLARLSNAIAAALG